MSGYDVIKKTIDEHSELMTFLGQRNELSLLTTVESTLPKVILLSAASDLESRVQGLIVKFFDQTTTSHEFAVSFVKNKAINRQFHTYFDWKGRSANPFFGLFGQKFKERIAAEYVADPLLKPAVTDFCEIGAKRNELVHSNYATYTLNMTASEVFAMYERALYFIERMPLLLQDS
ncbi:HEPN domain-containing protein [Saccharothrix hoggarensis]|uniref:HEPN domain-containing protein n=1 Tax=Saccharothrix hoggarensis TaxID=913853 RepID=A0ABW3QP39_9PSEU